MRFKRILLTFLTGVLFCSCIFSFSPKQAFADDPTFEEGVIYFYTLSQKATTSITYKTVGFVIHRDSRCSGGNCFPTNGDYGEVSMTQYKEIEVGNGQVQTFFKVPVNQVKAALIKAGLEKIKENDLIYMSAIFEVLHNGVSTGKKYYQLSTTSRGSGIKEAEPWANPNQFEQYYDRPVPFNGEDYSVDAYYILEGGKITSPLKTVNVAKLKNNETAEYHFDSPTTIGGKKYEIVKSYTTSDEDPIPKFIQEVAKNDSKVQDRSATIYFQGVQMIAEYRELKNPVKAQFIKEDGSTLQPDVDLGQKEIGAKVTYTFPDPITKGNSGYKLVKSYIVNVNDPSNQQYIQLEGQPSLAIRNITVATGGTNLVGVYRLAANCTTNPKASECQQEIPPPDNKPQGDCTYSVGPASKGSLVSGSLMNPSASGVLRADNRGSEQFDVLNGIPTSESLYANVLGMNYLFQNKWQNMTGQVTYTVPVKITYHKTWTIPGVPGATPEDEPTPAEDMEVNVTVEKTITVKRDYSYWLIDNLEVYKVDKTTVSNYALGGYGGTVTLNPTGYTAPTLVSDNKDAVDAHVHPQGCRALDLGTQTVPGGNSEPPTPAVDSLFQSEADKEVPQVKVNNDKVVFNGTNLMDDSQVDKSAPTPGTIPKPSLIGNNVLYQSGYNVSNNLINKASQPTSGTLFYKLIPGNIKGGADVSFNIQEMNPVTVHTPVVIYASISDDKAHNQKTIPAAHREATILDRPFTIYMPTSGGHRNITGYGNRDYAKYMKMKQVWFPFDVYSEDKSIFYPKETWITIPVNQVASTFFMPVWVDEGYYDVLFRTIAENAPASFTTESQANLNLVNHVATDVVPVDVIGRVYDFRITDIADFNWETFFRQAKGSSAPTGNHFWVGSKGIDGNLRSTSAPNFMLPVRQGSNTISGMKNIAVKTGYHFKFDVKTKGNMYNDQDGIRITPTFYFVQKDGKKRQAVDLYYHSDKEYFIQVGSAADRERRNVVLNSRLRNVPGQDLVNTSSTLWEMFAIARGWNVTKQSYMDSYIKKTIRQTYVGGYDVQILTVGLRTLQGKMTGLPSGVNIYRANAAEQQWYGEYSLPASVYVVPKGTKLAQYGRRLDDKSNIFLKNGYIVVNFTIETIKNGDSNNPYLQYIRRPGSSYYGSHNNQWKDMEGFASTFTTPYGVTFNSMDGDVMYYHADLSSYDDFSSSGTH